MNNLKKGLAGIALIGCLFSCGNNKKNLELRTDLNPSPKVENTQNTQKTFYTPKIQFLSDGFRENVENTRIYDSLGFNLDEKIAYDFLSGNGKIAKEYSKKGMTVKEGILNLAAGIGPEKVNSFHNTNKPDALAIFPQRDSTNSFIGILQLGILNNISNSYDISLNVCSNDSEFLKSLKNMENPSLIYVAGHGTGYAVVLGDSLIYEDSLRFNRGIGSKYAFDVRDEEIIRELSKKGKATLVLNNCLNGRALAPYIKEKAPNLKVVASKTLTNGKETKINSIYPMDLDFYHNGENVTYKN